MINSDYIKKRLTRGVVITIYFDTKLTYEYIDKFKAEALSPLRRNLGLGGFVKLNWNKLNRKIELVLDFTATADAPKLNSWVKTLFKIQWCAEDIRAVTINSSGELLIEHISKWTNQDYERGPQLCEKCRDILIDLNGPLCGIFPTGEYAPRWEAILCEECYYSVGPEGLYLHREVGPGEWTRVYD